MANHCVEIECAECGYYKCERCSDRGFYSMENIKSNYWYQQYIKDKAEGTLDAYKCCPNCKQRAMR